MENKNLLLCVTGGIAVFKAAALTSKLTQAGFNVKVVMTKSAKQFVTPLTFQVLSKNPVYDDTFDEKDSSVIAHIDLADWADLVLIAPATANIIGKLASGMADEIVSTTILATTKPVFIAPAMNIHMYENLIVQENMQKLKRCGYHFIEPNSGHLACGYEGKGRLKEPEEMVAFLKHYLHEAENLPLKGKRILVTAGPTQEKLDPVRYFTNHSSGKMGYEIARAAVKRGADVILVSGPTHLTPPERVQLISVTSAKEMFEAVMEHYPFVDAVIKSAAVADYRPKLVHEQKVKKMPGNWQIEMERTTDILQTLGNEKTHQVLIGFAAESENVLEHAKQKLEKKHLDFIVANNITQEGAGFKGDTNEVVILKKDGTSLSLPMQSKQAIAEAMIDELMVEFERNEEK